MLLHYFPTGILGLGLTALLASFMSGMAGNVTAFNTVWTMTSTSLISTAPRAISIICGWAAWRTIFGIALSLAAGLPGVALNNIMDMLQLVFAFVNATLVRDLSAGHVLEAHHRSWRLHRLARWHHGRRAAPCLSLPEDRPGIEGRLDRRAACLSQSDGTEFLDCDLCLDRLLADHRRGQPF